MCGPLGCILEAAGRCGLILTDADQLREALRVALQERDEARAEVERLLTAPRTFVTEAAYDEARAEAEDLRSRLAALQETNAATMRVIAEAQREACAKAVLMQWGAPEVGVPFTDREALAAGVRTTPLVTEVEP